MLLDFVAALDERLNLTGAQNNTEVTKEAKDDYVIPNDDALDLEVPAVSNAMFMSRQSTMMRPDVGVPDAGRVDGLPNCPIISVIGEL